MNPARARGGAGRLECGRRVLCLIFIEEQQAKGAFRITDKSLETEF
jgi:hypothetical protein